MQPKRHEILFLHENEEIDFILLQILEKVSNRYYLTPINIHLSIFCEFNLFKKAIIITFIPSKDTIFGKIIDNAAQLGCLIIYLPKDFISAFGSRSQTAKRMESLTLKHTASAMIIDVTNTKTPISRLSNFNLSDIEKRSNIEESRSDFRQSKNGNIKIDKIFFLLDFQFNSLEQKVINYKKKNLIPANKIFEYCNLELNCLEEMTKKALLIQKSDVLDIVFCAYRGRNCKLSSKIKKMGTNKFRKFKFLDISELQNEISENSLIYSDSSMGALLWDLKLPNTSQKILSLSSFKAIENSLIEALDKKSLNNSITKKNRNMFFTNCPQFIKYFLHFFLFSLYNFKHQLISRLP